MDFFMSFLISFGIAFCIAIITIFIASYLTHISMVRDNTERWAFGSFRDFKKAFDLISNWERNERFPNSFFVYDNNYNHISRIHASIIMFNNAGMILYPLSWIRFCLFIHKNKLPKKITKSEAKEAWFKK